MKNTEEIQEELKIFNENVMKLKKKEILEERKKEDSEINCSQLTDYFRGYVNGYRKALEWTIKPKKEKCFYDSFSKEESGELFFYIGGTGSYLCLSQGTDNMSVDAILKNWGHL